MSVEQDRVAYESSAKGDGKTKLTLTVDPRVPGLAKAYAQAQGTSISSLFSDYVAHLAQEAGMGDADDTEDKLALANFNGRILSAPGGPIELADDDRLGMAYLQGGWLVLDREQVFSPRVVAARMLLRSHGHIIRREFRVSRSELAALYRRTGHGSQGNGLDTFTGFVRTAVAMDSRSIELRWYHEHVKVLLRGAGGSIEHETITPEQAESVLEAAFALASTQDASYRLREYTGGQIAGSAMADIEGLVAIDLRYAPMVASGRSCFFMMTLRRQADTSLQSMGLLAAQADQVLGAMAVPGGIHLLSGPADAQVSRLLAAIALQHVKVYGSQRLVMSVGGLPEFIIDGVVHMPVSTRGTMEETGERKRAVIHRALHLRPDVLFINDIDTREVAMLALRAAQSGIQVWAGVSVTQPLAILLRLRSLGVPEYLLDDASLVRLLSTQRAMACLPPGSVESTMDTRSIPGMSMLALLAARQRYPDQRFSADEAMATKSLDRAANPIGPQMSGQHSAICMEIMQFEAGESSAGILHKLVHQGMEAALRADVDEFNFLQVQELGTRRHTILSAALEHALSGRVSLQEISAQAGIQVYPGQA